MVCIIPSCYFVYLANSYAFYLLDKMAMLRQVSSSKRIKTPHNSEIASEAFHFKECRAAMNFKWYLLFSDCSNGLEAHCLHKRDNVGKGLELSQFFSLCG